jgi:hypothetical protein
VIVGDGVFEAPGDGGGVDVEQRNDSIQMVGT